MCGTAFKGVSDRQMLAFVSYRLRELFYANTTYPQLAAEVLEIDDLIDYYLCGVDDEDDAKGLLSGIGFNRFMERMKEEQEAIRLEQYAAKD